MSRQASRAGPAGPAAEPLRPAWPGVHVTGLCCVALGAGMLVCALVDVVTGFGDEARAMALLGAGVGAGGLAAWRLTRVPSGVSRRGAFRAVSGIWLAVCVVGALPYVVTGVLTDPVDALFESVSGFTTTGASVVFPVEGNSRGLLLWRQLTLLYGGLGLVVLAAAVLPVLAVGGLELLAAETPGPTEDRLTPRMRGTALRLIGTFLAIVAATSVALVLAGLDVYDAFGLSVAAVATGGFAPTNASLASYGSLAVELVLVVAMIAGGTSFALHVWAVRRIRARRSPWSVYAGSGEFRAYIGLLALAVAVVAVLLVVAGAPVANSVRESLFTVVTIFTTTGFATADYVRWPSGAITILLLGMIVGAMAGSTSGGLKVVRAQVMAKAGAREVTRARHRAAVLPIRLASGYLDEGLVERIVGFVLLFAAVAIVGVLAVTALGADVDMAIGAVVSCMSSVGPGLGAAGPAGSFQVFNDGQLVVLSLLMLLGRLEIVPLLLAVGTLAAPGRRRVRLRGERREPPGRRGRVAASSAPDASPPS